MMGFLRIICIEGKERRGEKANSLRRYVYLLLAKRL